MKLADVGTPAHLINENGTSPIVLVCEHASHHIPADLDNLGLEEKDLKKHFVWDIGAEAMAREISHRLDAPLIVQRYSRLVYDCNRPPEEPSAMPETGETTPIPGNRGLDAEQKRQRTEQIYRPFHAAIGTLLDRRGEKPTFFVTIHSFTPAFKGKRRDVQLGILHDQDTRLADTMLELADDSYIARRNEPYGPKDGVTHTLNLHGGARGFSNVMLEVRNDLISDEAGVALWAGRLANLLDRATA